MFRITSNYSNVYKTKVIDELLNKNWELKMKKRLNIDK